jgi:Electron transfer DM13
MKKIFYVLAILFFFISCQEEGVLTIGNANNEVITPEAILRYQGVFAPTSGISVSGEAKIYIENGQYKVTLQDFSVSGGPDLKVYLSKADTPTQFVTLGNLTSQTVYPVPSGIDVADYSHVLIHCQQYNHLFAIAALTSN